VSITGSRREGIADAVIAVLGGRGSRGMTHRAVDEHAGVPTGSTSYYFRTRAELFRAAVSRLAELDLAALDRGGTPLERLRRVLAGAMDGEGRLRTLARYELVLEASRRPELHRSLAVGTESLHTALLALFPELPLSEAKSRAQDLLALIDGLLLANVTRPEVDRQTASELTDTLARVFDLRT
jgi:DNA-binding transcriptional regulator YbjK